MFPWSSYWQTFSVTGQTEHTSGFADHMLSISFWLLHLTLRCESSHRQAANEWACLCSNKTLFTKNRCQARFGLSTAVGWRLLLSNCGPLHRKRVSEKENDCWRPGHRGTQQTSNWRAWGRKSLTSGLKRRSAESLARSQEKHCQEKVYFRKLIKTSKISKTQRVQKIKNRKRRGVCPEHL